MHTRPNERRNGRESVVDVITTTTIGNIATIITTITATQDHHHSHLPTKPLPPRTTTFVPAGAALGVALANALFGAEPATATPSAPVRVLCRYVKESKRKTDVGGCWRLHTGTLSAGIICMCTRPSCAYRHRFKHAST